MENIFVKEASYYKNNINPVQQYIEQLITFYRLKYNLSYEECKSKVKELLSSHFQNRTIKFFERQENGDRAVREDNILNYINDTIKNNQILTPTFTTYLSKNEKRSLLSDFIANNVKRRSVAKKIAQKAKVEGNTLLFTSKNNEQNMMKIYNNSLSGAFAQETCILYNPTSHSTLTSVTRTVSSLANTSNESIISGNRYLPTIDDVINFIVYVVTYLNKDYIQQVVNKYNLHIPTIEETIEVLQYSSNLYFPPNPLYEQHILPLVKNLSDVERAGICYVNDLYHIRVYNENFFRNFINEITEKKIVNSTSEEYIEKIKTIDENILNFVHQIFFDEVKGYGKDYVKMNSIGLTSNLYETSLNVLQVLNKYSDFINAFLLSNITPFNSHRIRYMRRRTVVLSDTDSTCFTLDKWVEWYNNKFEINSKTIAVAGSIAFLATQVIIHLLAQLSKNLNVSNEDINVLAMKNEFLWTVHIPAEISKHYLAYTVMQEGNVFAKPDIEIKGVHLKNSAIPKAIIDDAKSLMKHMLENVHNNQRISLTSVINRIKQLELNIQQEIANGNTDYFKKSKIKNKEAYALGEELSPYQRHTFWIDIFSEKYGSINDPPYDVIIVPTILINKSSLKNWLESIPDTNIQNKLFTWLEKYKKTSLPTIYLENTLVTSIGIVEEIRNIIDYKRIILDITKQHRILLECLGVILNEELTISEMFFNI